MIKRRRKWFILAVCGGAFFMTYFARVAWSIIAPYSSLHATLADNGFIFSLFFVGYVAVQVPAGLVADRSRPSRVIWAALIGIALGALIGGLANQLWIEYVSSIVMGFAAGPIYPAALRLIVNTFAEGRELSTATGYYSTSLPIALTVIGAGLPPLVILVNWRWGLFVVTALCIIIGILAAFIRDPKVVPKETTANNLALAADHKKPPPARTVFLNRNVILIGIAGFVFFLSYWYINLYAYSYFLLLRLNPYQAGLAYSLLSVAGIFSAPFLGVLATRVGIKRITVASIGLYAALILVLPSTSTVYFIAALSILVGFLRFLANASVTNVVAVVGGSRTGTTAGLTNVFWQSSGIVGPLIATVLIGSLGYFFSWWLVGGIAFLSVILFSVVKVS